MALPKGWKKIDDRAGGIAWANRDKGFMVGGVRTTDGRGKSVWVIVTRKLRGFGRGKARMVREFGTKAMLVKEAMKRMRKLKSR